MTFRSFFLARLLCPHCGEWSAETDLTNMASKLIDSLRDCEIRIGDKVDAELDDFESAFLCLRKPVDREPTRVLHLWECPSATIQWAVLVIEDDIFKSAEPVRLSRCVLDSVHFMDERIYDYFEEITGHPLVIESKVRPDFWEVLHNALPDYAGSPCRQGCACPCLGPMIEQAFWGGPEAGLRFRLEFNGVPPEPSASMMDSLAEEEGPPDAVFHAIVMNIGSALDCIFDIGIGDCWRSYTWCNDLILAIEDLPAIAAAFLEGPDVPLSLSVDFYQLERELHFDRDVGAEDLTITEVEDDGGVTATTQVSSGELASSVMELIAKFVRLVERAYPFVAAHPRFRAWLSNLIPDELSGY